MAFQDLSAFCRPPHDRVDPEPLLVVKAHRGSHSSGSTSSAESVFDDVALGALQLRNTCPVGDNGSTSTTVVSYGMNTHPVSPRLGDFAALLDQLPLGGTIEKSPVYPKLKSSNALGEAYNDHITKFSDDDDDDNDDDEGGSSSSSSASKSSIGETVTYSTSASSPPVSQTNTENFEPSNGHFIKLQPPIQSAADAHQPTSIVTTITSIRKTSPRRALVPVSDVSHVPESRNNSKRSSRPEKATTSKSTSFLPRDQLTPTSQPVSAHSGHIDVYSQYGYGGVQTYNQAFPSPPLTTPSTSYGLAWTPRQSPTDLSIRKRNTLSFSTQTCPESFPRAVSAIAPVDPYVVEPRYILTKKQKRSILDEKLIAYAHEDAALMQTYDITALDWNVHVFVDLSNITIGFFDCLKLSRRIPLMQRMKAPPFSFEFLARVLQRGRPITKKIVAGSVTDTYNRKWPAYMQEANELGYEMNILQRVTKTDSPRAPRRNGRGQGINSSNVDWTTSGNETSDDGFGFGAPPKLKQGEQGVDELLHLKMLQSIIDEDPGTMILATGDAAEAEYSDGFLKNAVRALEKGWRVELVAWSKGVSSAWLKPDFRRKWGDHFRIIVLDEFVDDLHAVFAE